MNHAPTTATATIDLKGLAALAGIGLSTAERWKVMDRLPQHFHPAGSRLVRFHRQEVLDWIAAGCPPRDEWERMKKTGKG